MLEWVDKGYQLSFQQVGEVWCDVRYSVVYYRIRITCYAHHMCIFNTPTWTFAELPEKTAQEISKHEDWLDFWSWMCACNRPPQMIISCFLIYLARYVFYKSYQRKHKDIVAAHNLTERQTLLLKGYLTYPFWMCLHSSFQSWCSHAWVMGYVSE